MLGGRFVDYEDGRALGNHDGLEAYTTGQRARIGGLPEKYYIVKRPQSVEQSNAGAGSGDLYVVKGDKHPLLYSKLIVVDRPSFNWIQGQAPERLLFNEKSRFEVRYKHSPSTFAALISLPSNESNELVIEFEEPQKAVSPGQIAVLYDGDECLGGGVITKT